MSPWARRAAGRLPALAAWALALLACVLPLVAVVKRSFEVERVTLHDGTVYTAVGEVERVESPAGRVLVLSIQAGPGEPRVPLRLPERQVARHERALSLEHYRLVLRDPRTLPVLRDSLELAGGAALVALLLGLPAAWALARLALPLRRALHVLVAAPLVLPPLILGMGAARPFGRALADATSLASTALQRATAMAVLGVTLSPLVALLTARAWAAVPAGPYEAARLLAGPRAAWRLTVLPQVLPAALGAAFFVVLFALADFTVPDLMTFLLPGAGTPMAVFSKDVQLQWKQDGNTGRAVATGAPLLLLCLLALAVGAWLLRRGGTAAGARTGRLRARRRVPAALLPGALALVLLPPVLGLVVPFQNLLSWAGSGAETVATGSAAPAAPAAAAPAARPALFDVPATWARTPGAGEHLERWLKTGVAAALLATGVGVLLARAALRGGRLVRALVALPAVLALAAPGLVLGLGTKLLWRGATWAEDGVLVPALALAGRFLPFALLAAGLALRDVRPGYEEAAATLGAGPATRLARITGPLALPGLALTGLLSLVLALREIDVVVLLETRLLPLLIYDKIHFGRTVDEANLSLLYLAVLLVPALLALGAWALARRRRGDLGRA